MKNKITLSLIACLTLLLSSCVENSWTDGTLDYSFSPTTDSKGYFEGRAVLYTNSIKLDTYADYINSLNMKRSILDITGDFYAGDAIDGLELDVDGVGVYRFSTIYIPTGNTKVTFDSYYDSNFGEFMSRAFDYMSSSGMHDIIASGFLVNKNGGVVSNSRINLDFYNDLNVNINVKNRD